MRTTIIVLGTLFMLALTWLVDSVCQRRWRRRFDEKYPPIDDDAFLHRCHAGVDRQIALRTRRSMAEQTGIPYEQVYPEQQLSELGDE